MDFLAREDTGIRKSVLSLVKTGVMGFTGKIV